MVHEIIPNLKPSRQTYIKLALIWYWLYERHISFEEFKFKYVRQVILAPSDIGKILKYTKCMAFFVCKFEYQLIRLSCVF